MLSVPVQLIAWKARPGYDLLYVERDAKQLLTHSLTHSLSLSLSLYCTVTATWKIF